MTPEELPTGWSLATIADVTGRAEQRVPASRECITYIDIGSIDRESKRVESPQKLDGSAAPSRARQVVRAGDVLVSMTRPNLNAVAMVPPELDQEVASTGFDILRPEIVDPKWLFALVRTHDFVTAMSELVQGALYPAVRPRDIRAFDLPLPPLNEQKRVTDKLDTLLARVDACRGRLDHVPALLKRFRHSVLAAATAGALTADWREERAIYEDWITTDIQSVAVVGTGSTPLRSNDAFYAPRGTPWITSAATASPIVTEAKEFVTDAAIVAHRLKKFPPGSLLVAMYGEGRTRGQVTELGIEATINQACAAVIANEGVIINRFLKLVLESNYLQMRDLAEGGNQPNLNLTKIKQFQLRVPTKLEQLEIVGRVERLFAYADRLEAGYTAAHAHIERLTPALLAKAFRGELVPQDPADEPASVLLERIRAAREAAPKPTRRRRTAASSAASRFEVIDASEAPLADAAGGR